MASPGANVSTRLIYLIFIFQDLTKAFLQTRWRYFQEFWNENFHAERAAYAQLNYPAMYLDIAKCIEALTLVKDRK